MSKQNLDISILKKSHIISYFCFKHLIYKNDMNQYLITAFDGTNEKALDHRMNVRPYHLEGVKKMKETGNFIIGGAILNDEGKMIGSSMILQFEDPQELQNWMDSEPYIQQKVWEKFEVKPFRVANV